MTDIDHSDPRPAGSTRGRMARGLLAAGLLGIGAVAGAGVMAEARSSVALAPITPMAIRALSPGGIVSVRGRVAEIYGKAFIVADASGRALVDTGPGGDARPLVTVNEPVTIQGRFERGVIHAAFLVGPDNKAVALGPLAEPPHGPDGPPPPPPPPGHAGDAPPPPPPSHPAAAPAPVEARR